MHLGLVLDMASGGFADRVAVTESGVDTTFAQLHALSRAASAYVAKADVPAVMYIGTNHVAYPVALFGAAGAGVPLIPLNYRLGPDQLSAQIGANAVVVSDVPAGATAVGIPARIRMGSHGTS